jgi:alcohol dehydrogenase YqhD (iron-dependent ADH family)
MGWVMSWFLRFIRLTKRVRSVMKFEFHNPTQLISGAGLLSQLGKVAGKYGKKALIVTGGSSVKRTGAFDRAVASLKDAGVSVGSGF